MVPDVAPLPLEPEPLVMAPLLEPEPELDVPPASDESVGVRLRQPGRSGARRAVATWCQRMGPSKRRRSRKAKFSATVRTMPNDSDLATAALDRLVTALLEHETMEKAALDEVLREDGSSERASSLVH